MRHMAHETQRQVSNTDKKIGALKNSVYDVIYLGTDTLGFFHLAFVRVTRLATRSNEWFFDWYKDRKQDRENELAG